MNRIRRGEINFEEDSYFLELKDLTESERSYIMKFVESELDFKFKEDSPLMDDELIQYYLNAVTHYCNDL